MNPRIWYFHDSGEAYDTAMSSEKISDGDLLVIDDEGIVGVLIEAWPSAVTQAAGQFHQMADGHNMWETDDGKYAVSHAVAVALARARCYQIYREAN